MARRFESKVAVVTGAAAGIGAATVDRFACEGSAVACLDINVEGNEATATAARMHGVEAIAIACDVRSTDDPRHAFSAVMERWGRIDILVTNAGVFVGGPLPDIPGERWRDIEAVNLTGVLVANQLAAPIMTAQGSGRLRSLRARRGFRSRPTRSGPRRRP